MSSWLKMAGILLSVIGAGVTIATDRVNEQKMRETIREEVEREFAERFEDEEEES